MCPCAARELVKEVDYTLRTLSLSLLKQERGELAQGDIPAKYASCQVRVARAWEVVGAW